MALILHLETATPVCSVALGNDGRTIALMESSQPNSHGAQLTTLIEKAMQQADVSMKDIAAVAVSQGPGSYTGLRIGISAAKGLAYALGIPLIAIDTLWALAHSVICQMPSKQGLYCPMIDSKKMEVYAALYDCDSRCIEAPGIKTVEKDLFSYYLNEQTIYFFGNGMHKLQSVIRHTRAKFVQEIYCSAQNMVAQAHRLYESKQFREIAYFEPFYIKPFGHK